MRRMRTMQPHDSAVPAPNDAIPSYVAARPMVHEPSSSSLLARALLASLTAVALLAACSHAGVKTPTKGTTSDAGVEGGSAQLATSPPPSGLPAMATMPPPGVLG